MGVRLGDLFFLLTWGGQDGVFSIVCAMLSRLLLLLFFFFFVFFFFFFFFFFFVFFFFFSLFFCFFFFLLSFCFRLCLSLLVVLFVVVPLVCFFPSSFCFHWQKRACVCLILLFFSCFCCSFFFFFFFFLLLVCCFLPSCRHFPGVVVVSSSYYYFFSSFWLSFCCSFCSYSLCSNARIRFALLSDATKQYFLHAILLFVCHRFFPPSHRPQSSVLHLSFYHGCSILLLAMEQSWFEVDRRLDWLEPEPRHNP